MKQNDVYLASKPRYEIIGSKTELHIASLLFAGGITGNKRDGFTLA